MTYSIQDRTLLPAYIFRSSVMAWQCSLCGKMFSVSAEEAERRDEFAALVDVERAFRVHHCPDFLVTRHEKRKARGLEFSNSQ